METRGPGARILIVDDDASIRGLLRVVCGRAGIRADEVADGAHALELLDRNAYDLVLLDLAMPNRNGFDVIERFRAKAQRPAVFVLTALSQATFADLDPKIVQCVIRKPFDVDLAGAAIVDTATAMYEQRTPMTRPPAQRDSDSTPEARP